MKLTRAPLIASALPVGLGGLSAVAVGEIAGNGYAGGGGDIFYIESNVWNTSTDDYQTYDAMGYNGKVTWDAWNWPYFNDEFFVPSWWGPPQTSVPYNNTAYIGDGEYLDENEIPFETWGIMTVCGYPFHVIWHSGGGTTNHESASGCGTLGDGSSS